VSLGNDIRTFRENRGARGPRIIRPWKKEAKYSFEKTGMDYSVEQLHIPDLIAGCCKFGFEMYLMSGRHWTF
jgi:hypothetical protein